MPSFKDHFSQDADRYAAFRPRYPASLFRALSDAVARHDLAWDVGCGNGQLSAGLANVFGRVVATDASAEQVAQAAAVPGVEYRCAPAEASGCADGSVDLVTAAQAAHWFDLPAFYAEVRRVGRTGGAVALISYGVCHADERVDPILQAFYWETLAPYWPPERRWVEEGYRSLDFPFEALPAPALSMQAAWTLEQLLGYVDTWSAVKQLRRGPEAAALPAFRQRLARAWGDPKHDCMINWPLALRLGRIG